METYDEPLRTLFRRRRKYLWISIGGVLAAVTLVMATSLFSGEAAAAVFVLCAFVYLLAVAWLTGHVLLSRCPRCNRRYFTLFYGQFPGGWVFQNRCAHCGLSSSTNA